MHEVYCHIPSVVRVSSKSNRVMELWAERGASFNEHLYVKE